MSKPASVVWFVYILRCGDGSLYTGITKDIERRCRQHNAGTASRYTRSRRPTKLLWQEPHPSQSSALKRESAIKALQVCEAAASSLEEKDWMIPLYRDPWFTFRFAEDRLVGRFCLEDIVQGQKVSVYKIDPETGSRIALLARATVGAEGWVDLTEPLVMRAGEAFIAVPE